MKKSSHQIRQYIINNPYPDDDTFHSFVEKKGISPHDAETEVYGIISEILHGGKSKGKKPKVDEKEFELGMKVEMEHTSIPEIAEKITWDHLTERDDYYSFGKEKKIFDEI